VHENGMQYTIYARSVRPHEQERLSTNMLKSEFMIPMSLIDQSRLKLSWLKWLGRINYMCTWEHYRLVFREVWGNDIAQFTKYSFCEILLLIV